MPEGVAKYGSVLKRISDSGEGDSDDRSGQSLRARARCGVRPAARFDQNFENQNP